MQREGSARLTRQAVVVILLLTAANFLNYADRMVLAALVQPIKQEFGLSDTQIGLLTGIVFASVYCLAGIPLARLADRRSRKTILVSSIVLWSMMTAACGFTKSFIQLAIARCGVGIGEAGSTPAALSIISDRFSPQQRGTVIGLFYVGSSIGIATGLAGGGWLGSVIGWRATFLVFCIPGLVLGLLIFLFLREPERRIQAEEKMPAGLTAAVKELFSRSSFGWLLAASVSHTFLYYGILQWLPAFFMRTHGLALAEAGVLTGTVLGGGLIIGTLTGGYLNDRIALRGLEKPQYFCATAMLLLAATYAIAFWAPAEGVAIAAVFASAVIVSSTTPQTWTAILNVATGHTRALASALNIMVVGLLGVGLGPVAIGFFSDTLAGLGVADPLRASLNLALPISLVGMLLHIRAGRAMKADGIS